MRRKGHTMIEEKDVLFGIIRRGKGSELMMDCNDSKLPMILMGALSFLAATDDNFFTDLKGVVENVTKNGDRIRQMAARHQAEGAMIMIKPSKVKS